MNPAKRIGIKDIAEKAGVSAGTVDRVLHQRGDVKAETRTKVMAIVEELNYKPNIFARSLAYKKERRIVLISPDSRDKNPYWEKATIGVERAGISLEDHNTAISQIHFDASQKDSFVQAINQALELEPDGLVIDPVFKDVIQEKAAVFREQQIPFVFFDANIKGVGKLAYFGQDAAQSGQVAARLMRNALADDEKVLIIKLSKDKVFSQHINSRITGFIAALNTPKSDVEVWEMSLCEWETRREEIADMLRRKPYPGIFVPNTRVYKVARFLEDYQLEKKLLIGYDLIDENIAALKSGGIDFLISQRPEEQTYNAIMSLFNYIISKQEVQKTRLSPIDIIVKENIDYYC